MDVVDHHLFDQVDRAESMADQAQTQTALSKAEFEDLTLRVERLLMITEALWGILKEKHGYGDEELIQRITEIDMRDGKLDGRVGTSDAPRCPQCGRLHLVKRRAACLYCGTPITGTPFTR